MRVLAGQTPPSTVQDFDIVRSMKLKRFLIIFVVSIIVFSCFAIFLSSLAGSPFGGSKNAVFRVRTDSSSCWTGFFGDASREGCGSGDYSVTSSISIFAGSVQKQSDDGMPLTLQLVVDNKIVNESTTTAAYGIATASGSG